MHLAEGTPVGANYTGVILVHGIGDERRNATLQEAVNALHQWFATKAGLSRRPDGPGRVWLVPDLSENPDPDVQTSRVVMELEPPIAGPTTTPSPAEPAPEHAPEHTPLRLEFRELWWARSFGQPSVGETIQWARLQFRRETARLVLPIGKRTGPARASRPHEQLRDGQETADSSSHTRAKLPALRTWLRRALLQSALGAYEVVQYLWKAVQWLALAPLITLLLLLIAAARLLAFLPFLQSAAIASFIAVTDYVMLHWVASMQTYLLDDTRGAAIRERFTSELWEFVNDPHCVRVVVVAHSWGTVIAYDGLTMALRRPEFEANDTPITFICLAQALRRAWLLDQPDPRRLREALPERVRWLHFWSRYDPVAAGPLDVRALPPATDHRASTSWLSPGAPLDASAGSSRADPDAALRAALARCKNVVVVNTDSLFTDHITYWGNVEQVVGPIAYELVAGHPALQRHVEAHLAGPDEILERRWRVAWRATLALLGGVALGALALAWDLGNGAPVGQVVHHFGPGLLLDLLKTILGPLFTAADALTSALHLQPGPGAALPVPDGVLDRVSSAATAVALAAGAVLLIGRVVALPSPLAVRPERRETPEAPRWLFLLALGALAALPATLLCDYIGLRVVVPGLAVAWLLLTTLTFVISIVDTIARRRWGWLAMLLALGVALGVLPLAYFSPVQLPSWLEWTATFSAIPPVVATTVNLSTYESAPVAFGPFAEIGLFFLVGMALALHSAARARRWGWFALLLPSAALLAIPSLPVYSVVYVLRSNQIISIPSFEQNVAIAYVGYIDVFLPLLLYGLWTGVASLRMPPHPIGDLRPACGFALAAFLCGYAPSLVLLPFLPWLGNAGWLKRDSIALGVLTVALLSLCAALSMIAVGLSLRHATAHKRRGWWAALVVTPLAVALIGPLDLLGWSQAWAESDAIPSLGIFGPAQVVLAFFIVGCLLIVFSYGLWGDSVEMVTPRQIADTRTA
jgi:hypothetical protein